MRLTAIVLIALCGLWTAAASACRCAQQGLPEYFDAADVVMRAEVLSVAKSDDPVQNYFSVMVKAAGVFKGQPANELRTSTSSASCGVALETGDQLWVFGQRQLDQSLWVDTCSGTRILGGEGFAGTQEKDIGTRLESLANATRTTNSIRLKSTARQIGLLELYTSEGCSSCPVADRWVSRLVDDDRLWREVVPLSFHVDYWDYIGWKDRFSLTESGQRQRRYVDEGGVSTVYTPGFFYNGKAWRGWFGRHFKGFPKSQDVGILQATIGQEQVQVSFDPSAKPATRLQATVALLGAGLSSEIRAGENKGRRLAHDFVVLATTEATLNLIDDSYRSDVAMPRSDTAADRYAVAVWVSPINRQAPLQAVGGWLPKAGLH